jgi:hypothetical protein
MGRGEEGAGRLVSGCQRLGVRVHLQGSPHCSCVCGTCPAPVYVAASTLCASHDANTGCPGVRPNGCCAGSAFRGACTMLHTCTSAQLRCHRGGWPWGWVGWGQGGGSRRPLCLQPGSCWGSPTLATASLVIGVPPSWAMHVHVLQRTAASLLLLPVAGLGGEGGLPGVPECLHAPSARKVRAIHCSCMYRCALRVLQALVGGGMGCLVRGSGANFRPPENMDARARPG